MPNVSPIATSDRLTEAKRATRNSAMAEDIKVNGLDPVGPAGPDVMVDRPVRKLRQEVDMTADRLEPDPLFLIRIKMRINRNSRAGHVNRLKGRWICHRLNW